MHSSSKCKDSGQIPWRLWWMKDPIGSQSLTAAALQRCAWPMPFSGRRGVTHRSPSPFGFAHVLMACNVHLSWRFVADSLCSGLDRGATPRSALHHIYRFLNLLSQSHRGFNIDCMYVCIWACLYALCYSLAISVYRHWLSGCLWAICCYVQDVNSRVYGVNRGIACLWYVIQCLYPLYSVYTPSILFMWPINIDDFFFLFDSLSIWVWL